MLEAAGADPFLPETNYFRKIWSASELRSLVQNAIVGSSLLDILLLGAAAIRYSKMGQTSSSEEMGLLALEKSETVLSGDHPDTLQWCEFLAREFALHNKYEKAEAMARRALDGTSKVLRPEHPLTLQTLNTLAAILEKQGKCKEADRLKRDFGVEAENQTIESTSLTLSNFFF